MGGIFLAHFGPLSTNWASFKLHSLLEYCCWSCPSLYDYSVPSSDVLPAGYCSMSQSSNHLRLVSWTWRWVHFTQMTSTVTRSQSNRAPLGCGGTRDSHHGCADDKSAATVWLLSWSIWPTSLRNVSNTLLNLCHEELRQFWRQKWVQPGTSKVYLIKWPVSVCIYIYVSHKSSHKQHSYICSNIQQYIVWLKMIHFYFMPKIIMILRSCSMKIFSKFPTVNISKLNFLLVICIAKNFIWTTLKAIFSIFRLLYFLFITFCWQIKQRHNIVYKDYKMQRVNLAIFQNWFQTLLH